MDVNKLINGAQKLEDITFKIENIIEDNNDSLIILSDYVEDCLLKYSKCINEAKDNILGFESRYKNVIIDDYLKLLDDYEVKVVELCKTIETLQERLKNIKLQIESFDKRINVLDHVASVER